MGIAKDRIGEPDAARHADSATQHPGESAGGQEQTRRPDRPTLSGLERCILALTTVLIVAIALPRVAPGVCFDDPGDLQTACATLGIAHPPGYTLFAAAGWLLCTLLFFVEPAYVITLACLASMVAALVWTMLLLRRAGVHMLTAGALVLLLLTHDSVWKNAVVPEVYAPSLACLAGATYALMRYGDQRGRAFLIVAALLLGVLLISRPPSVLFLPGFVAALFVIERRHAPDALRPFTRTVALAAATAFVPIALGVTLVLARDVSANPYNYIEQYAEMNDALPDQNGDFASRWQRATWMVTAGEYRDMVDASWTKVRGKARWVRRQLGVYDTVPFVCALAILALGGLVLLRRRGDLFAAVACIMVGQVVYLLLYRVHGLAADLLPVLFAVVLISGAALATLFPARPSRFRMALMIAVYTATGVWVYYSQATRIDYAASVDATGYVRQACLETLPPRAVVISEWHHSRPLLYASCVEIDRPDVTILTGDVHLWNDALERIADRPVLFTMRPEPPQGWRVSPWKNLWRVERVGPE